MQPPASSTPITVAQLALRFAIVLNWLWGGAIVVLLVAMPTTQWIMRSLDLSPSPEARRIVVGLHAIAVLSVVAVPLTFSLLRRLLALVATLGSGDPFVAANSSRLRAMARTLLALQCIGTGISAVAYVASTPAHPLRLGSGFSITGWLSVLFTFMLAEVFAEGTRMREDLEGTV